MTTLADLPLAVHLHLWPALLALGLGPVAIYRRRRDVWHRATGYVWVLSMAVVALGSFRLEAGVLPIAYGFGAIHLLSLVVLYGLWRGVAAARARDRTGHAAWMRALYWQALIVPGSLTLLPGRTLNRFLFPERPWLGIAVIAGTGTVLLARLLLVRARGRGPVAG